MLLTISTTHQPATDLGFLLHKNPAHVQSEELPFGRAHVFYPSVGAERCTAALFVEVDAVALSRREGRSAQPLEPYVNDRPYAASSFLSVAIARLFRSAMAGQSRERPSLADAPIPLEATISVLPCRGGEDLLRRLFEPLGYALDVRALALDPVFTTWGTSRYLRVTLRAERKLSELLTHLYVLVPVLDDDKHYFIGEDEVAKLVRHGENWLAAHPERELIAQRYLKHRRSLADAALAQLLVDEDPAADEHAAARALEEEKLERPMRLDDERVGAVLSVLRATSARSVIDLGCGEGKLMRALIAEPTFERLAGVDVSHRALEHAADRIHYDKMNERQRARVSLLHGSLVYRDRRFAGFDAATLVEVIEHLDPPRVSSLERVVFEHARPRVVVVTTPNAEYNVHFEALAPGAFRHRDHRFEWTRARLASWAAGVSERFGYASRTLPIGPAREGTGSPTQMAVFERSAS